MRETLTCNTGEISMARIASALSLMDRDAVDDEGAGFRDDGSDESVEMICAGSVGDAVERRDPVERECDGFPILPSRLYRFVRDD